MYNMFFSAAVQIEPQATQTSTWDYGYRSYKLPQEDGVIISSVTKLKAKPKKLAFIRKVIRTCILFIRKLIMN